MYNDLTLFGNDFDLFDPFFGNDLFYEGRGKKHQELLKTDVIENDKNYELVMDVPGLEKKDISIEVDNGYLTIQAQKTNDEDSKKKHFIRKERTYYSAKRSFYVGDIKEEEIKASMVNGELHIEIPKEEKKVVTKKTIQIA